MKDFESAGINRIGLRNPAIWSDLKVDYYNKETKTNLTITTNILVDSLPIFQHTNGVIKTKKMYKKK